MHRARPRSLVATALAVGLVAALSVAGRPGVAADPDTSADDVVVRESARPNIIVVMADDMRVDDLRFSPKVRRLVVRHGLTFENSFSEYPLCCPARASFLTGRYAHNHHVWSHLKRWGYKSFDDSRTLATSLRRAGYRTGFIGKYLNGYGPQRSRVSGTPSWRYVPRGWSDWRAAFENPHVRGIRGGVYYYFNTPYNVNGHVDNGYSGRYQTNVVGDFSTSMARRFGSHRNPFFMYVNYVAPHHGAPQEPDDPGVLRDRRGRTHDYTTPARPQWVKGRFDHVVRRAAGLPRGGGPAEADVSDKPPYIDRLAEPTRRERRAMRETTRQRAESIFIMDQQIGRLVAALKRTGEWSNTVFMFTSDNGFFQGEHRVRGSKYLGHEPSLRVPFVMTGPGMRGNDADGHKRYDPITTVDVTATILDIADARPPREPDGVSRLPTIRGGDRGWTSPVMHETLHTGGDPGGAFDDVRTAIGVRTAQYSMLRYRNGAELYDLVEDPLQNHSVWRSEAYAPVRRDLMAVWRRMKDCRGNACRSPLPEQFQADSTQTRALTRAYWAAVDRTYGW